MSSKEIALEVVELLKPMIGEIRDDVKHLDERMGEMSERVESLDERVKRIEIFQENEILPRLKHIEECYTSTYDKYKDELDNLDKMKNDIYVLNNCIRLYSKTKKRKYKNKCIKLEG